MGLMDQGQQNDEQDDEEEVGSALQPTSRSFSTKHYEAAQRELGMTPEERSLYERHLENLWDDKGFYHQDGHVSTLYATTTEVDGKTYVIPTVRDGHLLPPKEAVEEAFKEGIDKFPHYSSEHAAGHRYHTMHEYMDRDTGEHLMGANAGLMLKMGGGR